MPLGGPLPWIGRAAQVRGAGGGIVIILLAHGITAATGLSLSSIATNTRMGAGGPYAIISRATGVDGHPARHVVGGPDFKFVERTEQATRSSCVFAADSGWESALA